MADKTRKGKEPLKPDELNILLEEVEANKGILFDRFKGAHTNKQKAKRWGEIAQWTTAVNGTSRSDGEVRKKWTDFVSLTKKKASDLYHQTTLTGAGVNMAQRVGERQTDSSRGVPRIALLQLMPQFGKTFTTLRSTTIRSYNVTTLVV